MPIKSLVAYLTPSLLTVKAQVLQNVGDHTLVKVTERKNLRYRHGLLMLVPTSSLQPR